MPIDFDVTHRILQLGTRDSITGWFDISFVLQTIKMIMVPKGHNIVIDDVGFYPRYQMSGFTQAGVTEGDQIIDAFTKQYDVHEVIDIPLGNSLFCYECNLVRNLMPYDRPSYGTGASVDDPRYRTGDFLNTYIDPAKLLKNDGVTRASWTWMWAGGNFPIPRIFVNKAYDIVYCISRLKSNPLDEGSSVYGYNETVPIKIYTIDKTDISGENLCWQAEQELRRIFRNNPYGSFRRIDSSEPKPVLLGSLTLYSMNVEIEYERGLT